MPLTRNERQALRAWRDICQAALVQLNTVDPPGLLVQPFGRFLRHECALRAGVSRSLELREVREVNPELWGCYCSAIEPFVKYSFPHEDCQGGGKLCDAGKAEWVWKQGKCQCGMTARSVTGFVEVADGQ